MSHEELPDNDPDLTLAREFGRHHDLKRAEDRTGQAGLGLSNFLTSARTEIRRGDRLEPVPDMWKQVEAATRPHARILTLHNGRVGAGIAAAIVLLIGFAWIRPRVLGPEVLVVANPAAISEYVADDGSTVTLRPNSELARSRRTGTYLLTGEAFFDVAPRDDTPFVVRSGNATVTVLGTRFVVSDWRDGTRVYLEEGRIRLDRDGGGQSVDVAPGESYNVTSDDITQTESVEASEAVDWMSGSIVFESEELASVTSELAFHFGVSIVVPPDLENELVTGRIVLSSAEAALRDLGVVMGGTFVERDGAFHLELP